MNAERLHEICTAAKAAMESTTLVERMTRISDSLQEIVNQPQNPDAQKRS